MQARRLWLTGDSASSRSVLSVCQRTDWLFTTWLHADSLHGEIDMFYSIAMATASFAAIGEILPFLMFLAAVALAVSFID
jgi:hypothetical protein